MTEPGTRRTPLSRDRVLAAAVALADAAGLEAVSMRSLAERLGVVPMALYKHVPGKDALIDGMIDVVVGEIDPARTDIDWRPAVRERILSARRALLRHPWAVRAMESRSAPTAAALGYMDSLIAMLLEAGFSDDLTHHAMHALGSRMFGFTQELFTGGPGTAPEQDETRRLAIAFPNIARVASVAQHEQDTIVGSGCDDQFEFEFALDLVLDGFELLRQRNWHSKDRRTGLDYRQSRRA